MSYNEHIIKRMNYYKHNQNMSKYKNENCLYHIQFSAIVHMDSQYNVLIRYHFMEWSTLEATYVFNYSSAGVLFQGICSCMMPMADIHNKNKIGTC